jgi:hypothetical protein
METTENSCKCIVVETIIKRKMARHYKRLEERLSCINLNPLVFETISKEWRFLEQDLIEECKAVLDDKEKSTI